MGGQVYNIMSRKIIKNRLLANRTPGIGFGVLGLFPIPLTCTYISRFRVSLSLRHSFTTCQRRALAKKNGIWQVLVGHPRTAKQLLYLVVCILLQVHNVILCSTFIHIFRIYIVRLEFSNGFMQPSDREDQWDRFPGAHSWEWMQGHESSQFRRSR